MAEDVTDSLIIPTESLKQRYGFSLDIGYSLVKLVYCTTQVNEDEALQFRLFEKSAIDEALEFMKVNSRPNPDRGDTKLPLRITGVSGHKLSDYIAKKCNAQVTVLADMDCFVTSLMYLCKNFYKQDLVIPHPKWGLEEAEKMTGYVIKILPEVNKMSFKNMHIRHQSIAEEDENEDSDDDECVEFNSYFHSDKDLFPCLLVVAGSGTGISVVNADGTYEVLDGITRGGRYCLALGSLVLGTTSFDELMSLAEEGNHAGVDVTGRDLKSGDMWDPYGLMPDDLMLYCLGKAANRKKEDFKREDLARAIVSTVIQDLVQITYLHAELRRITRVIYCGTFIQHEVIRSEITKFFALRTATTDNLPVQHEFLRSGGYLGALGAFLKESK